MFEQPDQEANLRSAPVWFHLACLTIVLTNPCGKGQEGTEIPSQKVEEGRSRDNVLPSPITGLRPRTFCCRWYGLCASHMCDFGWRIVLAISACAVIADAHRNDIAVIADRIASDAQSGAG